MARAPARSQDKCLLTYEAIFNMSRLATGMTFFNFSSGLMMRPSFNLYFLMYTQIFFVTSVRGIDLSPQIAANAGLRVFGAKIPFPAFFIAAAFFLALAARAFLPAVFFSAVIFFSVAFVTVVFVVVTVVVVVIAMEV